MFNNDHKIILFFRILKQIATSRSRLLQKDTTRLMLCNATVNTVITGNNGYFEGRNFISKNFFSNLTKLYSQKNKIK